MCFFCGELKTGIVDRFLSELMCFYLSFLGQNKGFSVETKFLRQLTVTESYRIRPGGLGHPVIGVGFRKPASRNTLLVAVS